MKRKILLMGKSGTGKTSMRSLIFSSYRSEDTKRLGSTIDVEHSHVRFPGNLVLNIWDCGGQTSYMESYKNTQRDQVFSSVCALVYVVDVVNTDVEADGDTNEWETDLRYFSDCLSALQTHTPDAEIFCLLHKMDLIEPERRKSLYMSRVADLRRKAREVLREHIPSPSRRDESMNIRCFATSIWDATLYKAWSNIVHTIVPDVRYFETLLTELVDMCSASEVVLFEKSTFLVMSHYTLQTNVGGGDLAHSQAWNKSHVVRADDGPDSQETLLSGLSASMLPGEGLPSSQASAKVLSEDRFERVSELVKHFKIACLDSKNTLQGFELRTPTFLAYMDALTSTTYLLVIVSDPRVQIRSIKNNIEACRKLLDTHRAMSDSSG